MLVCIWPWIWRRKNRYLCCAAIGSVLVPRNSRIQIWRYRHLPVAAINMDEFDIDTRGEPQTFSRVLIGPNNHTMITWRSCDSKRRCVSRGSQFNCRQIMTSDFCLHWKEQTWSSHAWRDYDTLCSTPFLSRLAASIIRCWAWVQNKLVTNKFIRVWKVHSWLWDPTNSNYINRPCWSGKIHSIGKLFDWPRFLCCCCRSGWCISWTRA